MRTADRWQRVQEIFNNAADLPESDQAAYLERACLGDAALRAAVERMLLADRTGGDLIEDAVRRETVLFERRPDPLAGMGKVGKYELLAPVGEGGFGVVYKGRDPVLQRFVAIKACGSRDKKIRQRFFREAQIAAGLQHPNVVTVHDLGIQEGVPYLVQEYLEGEDLDHVIARRDPLGTPRRIEILTEIARGLAYAHEHGVLHRDVKPANVRLLPAGTVKLMDFGIARLIDEEARLTSQGQTLGTVGYLAPELLEGNEPNEVSDVFSFGVLAYELLAYQRPFPGDSFSEVAVALLSGEHPALGEVVGDGPSAIVPLVERCLARDPAARPAGFATLLAELVAAASSPAASRAAASGELALGTQVGAGEDGEDDGPPPTALAAGTVPVAMSPPAVRRGFWIAGLVVAALAGGLAGWRLRQGPATGPATPPPLATRAQPAAAPAPPGERAGRLQAFRERLRRAPEAGASDGTSRGFVRPRLLVAPTLSSSTEPPAATPCRVVLAVEVDADGTVRSARVLRAEPPRPAAEARALAAAPSARFLPATRGGGAIASSTELVIEVP